VTDICQHTGLSSSEYTCCHGLRGKHGEHFQHHSRWGRKSHLSSQGSAASGGRASLVSLLCELEPGSACTSARKACTMATTQLPLCRALLAAVLAVTVLAATTAADPQAGGCSTWAAACAGRVAWAKLLGCLPAFLAGALSWRPAALCRPCARRTEQPRSNVQVGAHVLAVWAGRRRLPGVSHAPPGDQGGGLVPRSGRPVLGALTERARPRAQAAACSAARRARASWARWAQ